MYRPLLCLLVLVYLGCEQPQETAQACYICSDFPPHAQVCTLELGRIEERKNTYRCNLYFGSNPFCESAEHCCRQFDLVADQQGECVSPKSLGLTE